MSNAIDDRASWTKLLIGFGLLFAVLQGSAAALQSLRGENGLWVAAASVGAAALVQRAFFARSWREVLGSLGLGAPRGRGLVAALVVSAAALCAVPIFLMTYGGVWSVYPGAALMAFGIFLQAGVAEEIVFRGFLYGHIRRGRGFWRAALLSAVPFAAAHLYLFATMAWPIALTALLLSVLLTFPFAKLYELGGRTIWAPALAHAVVQGGVKLIVVDAPVFPIIWMAASFVAMWLAFAFSSSAYSRS